jgi:hypothetical protein
MRDDLLGDVEMLGEGGQFYIFVNGVKIAKRENCQWTNLVPGYSIEDLDGGAKIAIYYSKLPQAAVKPDPSKKSRNFNIFHLLPAVAGNEIRIGFLALQLAQKFRFVILQILSALKSTIKRSD